MALPIITPQDFKGSIKIVANQFKSDDLQYYIDEFLPKYLRCVLGDAAFNEISNQDRQKWTDLINGKVYTSKEDVTRIHNSILDSIKKFIYFEFNRDNYTATQTGKVNGLSENSNNHNPQSVFVESISRYNSGASAINESLQCYLDAYENIDVVYDSVTDNMDGTYTILINNTEYLETGDYFFLEGNEYLSTEVVSNVSVVFEADAGMVFSEDSISWTPFSSVVFTELEYCCI